MTHTPRQADYWQAVYDEGNPGWDKGAPAPPLQRVLAHVAPPAGTTALVPGCGFGHEALMLARIGYQVTAVDFALAAIAGLQARAGDLPVKAVQADLFGLADAYPEAFDLVVEHTCFCAIPVEMRDEYARVMARVLRAEGQFLGLFYETERESGPPFRTTREDVERHFSPHFEIRQISRPPDSFAGREDREWLALMRKKSDG
ncbi:MAG: methyltransferase domain-containing protein [Candidatus Latescibacteria bacterium]|nr:methyltransferase domain-containing protein [Candidatus Latescibacterota bacterium]